MTARATAGGDLIGSWLNPTSILVGLLAVATCAYLAAVFLVADARRLAQTRPRGATSCAARAPRPS